jgi:hypothetical protein
MASNVSKYKEDLRKLITLGNEMHGDLLFQEAEERGTPLSDELKSHGIEGDGLRKLAKSVKDKFEDNYQRWYTEAHAVIRQLIPDRLSEFEHLYKGDASRRSQRD